MTNYVFTAEQYQNYDVVIDFEERVYDRINAASARGLNKVTIPAIMYGTATRGFTRQRKEGLFAVIITRLQRDGYHVYNDAGVPYYNEQFTIAW